MMSYQVGHVQQSWVEIWGPDDAEGTHEVLGSAIGDDREANARLWAAAPKLVEALRKLLAVPAMVRQSQRIVAECDVLRTDSGMEAAGEIDRDVSAILDEARAALREAGIE